LNTIIDTCFNVMSSKSALCRDLGPTRHIYILYFDLSRRT
jgi:hypothetical protein